MLIKRIQQKDEFYPNHLPRYLQATRRMVEANKKKREEKTKQTKQVNKEIVKESVKESVKEVLAEPFYEPKPVAPPDPYANLRF